MYAGRVGAWLSFRATQRASMERFCFTQPSFTGDSGLLPSAGSVKADEGLQGKRRQRRRGGWEGNSPSRTVRGVEGCAGWGEGRGGWHRASEVEFTAHLSTQR